MLSTLSPLIKNKLNTLFQKAKLIYQNISSPVYGALAQIRPWSTRYLVYSIRYCVIIRTVTPIATLPDFRDRNLSSKLSSRCWLHTEKILSPPWGIELETARSKIQKRLALGWTGDLRTKSTKPFRSGCDLFFFWWDWCFMDVILFFELETMHHGYKSSYICYRKGYWKSKVY